MLSALIYQNLYRSTGMNYFWIRRILFTCLILALLFTEIWGVNIRPDLGRNFLIKIGYALFFMFLVLAPLSCGAAFSEERSRNTLGVLMLTELSALEIIFSKLFSRTFAIIFYLLGTFPVFMICFSFGGISAEQIINIFVALIASIIFGGSLGLFVSVLGYSKVYMGSVVNVIVFFIFLCFYDSGISLNSWQAMLFFFDGQVDFYSYSGVFIDLLLSVLLVYISVKILPKQIFASSDALKGKRGGRGLKGYIMERIWYTNKALAEQRKLKKINFQYPIEWKDFYFVHYPKWTDPTKERSCIVSLISFIVILYAYPLILAIFLASVFLAGLKSFSQESKGFEILLMTDLTNREIIVGKFRAIYRSMGWFLRVFSVIYAIFMVAFLWVLPATILVLVNIICVLVFVTICAMFFSFYTKSILQAMVSGATTIVFSQILLYTIFLSMNLVFGGLVLPCINLAISYYLYKYMIRNLRKDRFINRFYGTT